MASAGAGGTSGAPAIDLESSDIWGSSDIEAELASLTTEQIVARTRMLTDNIRIMNSDVTKTDRQLRDVNAQIADNESKIKLNSKLPYLVANVIEILDAPPADNTEDLDAAGGALVDTSDEYRGKSVVIKTTTRQTVYLPIPGLVDPDELKPGELVGVNKDSHLILEKLPPEYDARVKAMELDEKPTEDYSDIGGCDKQIQELIEAVVLPMTHADRFKKLGVRPPKGVLLHGPPGTGKTLLARACAKSTDAVFLKLAGTSLVQMFIGDGAKMVRDAFDLAREKSKDRGGAIIFIDEIDAVGTKRQEGDTAGGREVERTMLELLNQLDGFSPNEKVKVIAATNRPDTLDPALLRSGRLDRKIELPLPDEKSRMRILQIHARKMTVDTSDVNFEELSRSTDDFNGAMLKAVCVEAGMIALRREATAIRHEDFVEGIQAVQLKKKSELRYYV